MPCTIASRYRYGINSSSRLKPEWPGWRVVPGRSVWETRERERDLRMGRQWRQHVNETTRCHWAHQSGQPSGKSKASTICFTFPLFSHRSLSLCPPELIPSPGFKCHLVLSTWTMWNFSSHSFGADILFIFWPVRFRWTFECPCGKRWLYVCIFRTWIFIV